MQSNFSLINFSGILLALGLSWSFCSGKLIYHQTMTPSWLEAHASFIDSSRTATAEQLTFNGGVSRDAALLKVPLIPAGFFKVNTPLTVEITVANDVTIGTTVDSDISFGVSDGTRFIGFDTCDKGNYGTNAPCYKMEGLSGTTVSSKKVGPYTTKPSQNFYPGQFLFTIKLNERWGACYTAHDGGFVTTAAYSNRLMISKGLTLEIYQEDKSEKVGIRFIKVSIKEDDV